MTSTLHQSCRVSQLLSTLLNDTSFVPHTSNVLSSDCVMPLFFVLSVCPEVTVMSAVLSWGDCVMSVMHQRCISFFVLFGCLLDLSCTELSVFCNTCLCHVSSSSHWRYHTPFQTDLFLNEAKMYQVPSFHILTVSGEGDAIQKIIIYIINLYTTYLFETCHFWTGVTIVSKVI